MRLAAADIYADQLLLKGYGYPLWFPEPYPTDVDGEIFVGHVGHICRGSFHTLFNVRWSSSHSANPMGLPQGFEPLEFPPRLLWNPSVPVMDDGFICSESVKKSTGSAEVTCSTPFIDPHLKLSFECSSEKGGLLVVSGGGAQQEILLKNWLVPKYIFQHHSSWCRFARDVFGLDLTADEIIFVAGTVKASQWAVAAFMDRSVMQAASLQAGDGTHLSIGGSVSRSLRTSMSVEHRAGPRRIDEGATHSGSEGLPNQCLFVYRYKMRRRRKVSLWQKLYEEGGKLLDRKFQFSWRSDRFDDRSDNGPASGGSGSRGGSGGSGGSGNSDTQPSGGSGGGTCPAPDDGLEIYGDDDPELDTDSNVILTDDSANTTVFDPLDIILDYILEKSTCEAAIASDEDVRLLKENGYDINSEGFEQLLHTSGIPIETSPDVHGLARLGICEAVTPSPQPPGSKNGHPFDAQTNRTQAAAYIDKSLDLVTKSSTGSDAPCVSSNATSEISPALPEDEHLDHSLSLDAQHSDIDALEFLETSAAIYARQLYDKKYGYPLWRPDGPFLNEEELHVGDIGYINHRDGSFTRLFNTMLPTDHFANRKGVPDSVRDHYAEISSSMPMTTDEEALADGVILSRTIVHSLRDGEYSGRRSGRRSGRGGSLLNISGGGAAKDYIRNEDVRENLLNHWKSWESFATETFGIPHSLRQSNIAFVGGLFKTSEWLVAAFTNEPGTPSVQLRTEGDTDHVSQIIRSVQGMQCIDYRTSDRDARLPSATQADDKRSSRDQSVFMNYYKVYYRGTDTTARDKPGGPKPRYNDPVRVYASVGETIDEHHEHRIEVVDPVDRLLAYIIEHSSCDVAVACYEDLQVAEEAILMDRAEDIDEYLRRLRPQIDVSSEGVGTVARTTEMPNLPHEQVLSIPLKAFPAPSPSLFNMPTLPTSGWMFLSVRLPQWHLLALPEGKTRTDVEQALQTCNHTDTVAIGRLLLTA